MQTLCPITLALSRAQVTPFTPDLWAMYADASGDAHTVVFHAEDNAKLTKQLGLEHWDPDTTTVILDDGGLTWNSMAPVNAYAWQVSVPLTVDTANADVGTPSEYWEVAEQYEALEVEADLANLPPEMRAVALRCDHEARRWVVMAMGRQLVALDKAERNKREADAVELVGAANELAHDWTKP